jgi:hypothetical protein
VGAVDVYRVAEVRAIEPVVAAAPEPDHVEAELETNCAVGVANPWMVLEGERRPLTARAILLLAFGFGLTTFLLFVLASLTTR